MFGCYHPYPLPPPPPSLPLPPCLFKHSPSTDTSLSQVLLHPILPSTKWSSSPCKALRLNFIHLYKHGQTPSTYFSLPTAPLHASLHSHMCSSHISHTHFHYPLLPIQSLHRLLSICSFPLHTHLTTVPYSMSMSPPPPPFNTTLITTHAHIHVASSLSFFTKYTHALKL